VAVRRGPSLKWEYGGGWFRVTYAPGARDAFCGIGPSRSAALDFLREVGEHFGVPEECLREPEKQTDQQEPSPRRRAAG
jgi:hypothetical protein